MEYPSSWAGFELQILVVIGTDCIGSCKSNYHTIKTTLFQCEFPMYCEVYSIQLDVIKFINYLRQVGGFLGVLRFPPPLKLTAKYPLSMWIFMKNYHSDHYAITIILTSVLGTQYKLDKRIWCLTPLSTIFQLFSGQFTPVVLLVLQIR
jgi:hypothetical protein